MKYLLIAIVLLGAVSAQFSTGFEVETPAKEEAELTNFDEDNFDMEGQDALDFDDEDNTEFLDDEDEESDLPAGREADDEGELESDQDEDSYWLRKAWRHRKRHLRNLRRY